MRERLHKTLAHCGVGSRRECETIIEQGRVRVNGSVVTKLGTKVDPDLDKLNVDGEDVRVEEKVYYLLNKPPGYICTSHDERGRPRALDLVKEDKRRVYTVGRLDAESEGLTLLTNDGEIANAICHPRYQVDKTYRLLVKGPVREDQVERIETGVWLAEGKTGPTQVRSIERHGPRAIVTVTVWEGRNRELRRIFAKVNLRVSHLQRIAIGPLSIEGLEPGEYRRITSDELGFALERLKEGWTPLPVPEAPKLPAHAFDAPGGPRPFRRRGRGGFHGGPARGAGPAGERQGPWEGREPFGNFRPRRAGPRGPGWRGPYRDGPGRSGPPPGR